MRRVTIGMQLVLQPAISVGKKVQKALMTTADLNRLYDMSEPERYISR